MKKILVTGGTGYIGSHTVVELIQRGYEVLIIDDLSNSDLKVLDGIQAICKRQPLFIKLDIRDKVALQKLVKQHPDIIAAIHFAAKKAVGESVEQPLLYYQVNVGGLINLIDALSAIPKMAFVFSSSCTVYGQPDKLPVSEQSPLKPAESPYGYTKQVAEQILSDYAAASTDFSAIALRYFNPVGAHESGLIGELPIGAPNNLVPFITQVAAGLREELSIFGNDYGTPDGTAIRDYIHITDLAKAHIAALERLINKKQEKTFEFYNLGTGKGHSVLEVVRAFEKVAGRKLQYKVTGRRAGDVERIYADTMLAEKVLGWKANLDIDAMMLSAWKWQQQLKQRNS